MPPNTNIPNEGPKGPEGVKDTFSVEKLARLKKDVETKQFQNVVDALITKIEKDGDVPTPEKINAFILMLSVEERKALTDFLGGTLDKPEEEALHDQLKTLRQETGGDTPAEELTGPAKKIMDFLDQKMNGFGLGDQISEFGKKFGFSGEAGPKQIEFVKNILVNMAAKLFESIAFSIANLSPTSDMEGFLQTSLQLRLIQLKQSDADSRNMTLPDLKALYKKAYLAEAKRCQKLKLPFTPPTIEDAVNPPKVAPVVPNQVAAAPIAPEKVEGTKEVKLLDATTYSITRNADKKIIVKTGDQSREVKFAGGEFETVFIRTPSATDKGGIDFQTVDKRTITFDAVALRDAVKNAQKDKAADAFNADGAKIDLIELQNNS